MTSLSIVVSKKKSEQFDGDLLVLFGGQDAEGNLVCDDDSRILIPGAVMKNEFVGKEEQKLLLYSPFPGSGRIKAARIAVIGLGKLHKETSEAEKNEILRVAGGVVAEMCNSLKVKELGIALPKYCEIDEAAFACSLVEGVHLGLYRFLVYKKVDEDRYQGLKKITVFNAENDSATRKAIARAGVAGEACCTARDMANEPGNGWTPAKFAKFGEELAQKCNIKCTVLEKEDMQELGMGGILAVNQGSHEPPKLVCLDYHPTKAEKTIMLVGKGLTFDSGGISLKPAQGMMDMKYDMCGGAAVIATMQAVAEELPDVRVVCLVPSTDNMNGGGAVKPGDIITHYGGTTSEIENTDAEGRLILADALAYGIEQYKPTCVIDLATLTGAVIIALGHHYTGLMSNNKKLAELLKEAGDVAGEPLWQLPLGEQYVKQLKSTVADIKNTGGRPGGSITAAEYLHNFVGKTPWAHLDIAGTAWDFTEKSYIPKGPSGTGCRTLIEFIRRWNNEQLL